MGLLNGKVAVITGAGSGMGKASTRVFAREGARVLAADISGAEETTAAEVGDAVVPFHCDVSKEADVEAMIAKAVQQLGRVDAVLNVAGIGTGGLIANVRMESQRKSPRSRRFSPRTALRSSPAPSSPSTAAGRRNSPDRHSPLSRGTARTTPGGCKQAA